MPEDPSAEVAELLHALTAADWERVKQLLDEAAALEPGRRSRFLDAACGSDAVLRAELQSLLSTAEELSSGFLESPPSGEPAHNAGPDEAAAGVRAGQIVAHRFEMIRKVGEGGMGQVWLAEQISPVRRRVALKLIRAGMYDGKVVQRFQAEGQSLALMDHPAIAKVFDAGTTLQGQPFLAMEFVFGQPLTEYCDQHELDIEARLDLFIQVCEGVQHAHQKAIIHRDLKPSNILVVDLDGHPAPRIIDFGLAKSTTGPGAGEPLLTQLGQFLGTPGYMSPEQLELDARDIDTRTDVYSLGVILYVLLTGLQPFETKRARPPFDEWLRRLREEEPPSPSTKVNTEREALSATAKARGTGPRQLASRLRGDLDWITMKALERDRARRYGTPSEMAADLRRYLNDEPVHARPPTAMYQIHKFMRRHRLAAGFIGLVTILSIAASAAALVAVRQRHAAEFQRQRADSQAERALQAQARLLTQDAAQRLKDGDVPGAQSIILEVLTNPLFKQSRTPAALSVFQDVRAADAQLAVIYGAGQMVYNATYSPDGTRIVTVSADDKVRVWDAQTGMPVALLAGHSDRVQCAAFSPDGTRLVTSSYDKTARIWDGKTFAPLAVLAGHTDRVQCAAFSRDGTRIVTASLDNTVRIWDSRAGTQLAVLRAPGIINSAEFSPDGTRMAVVSDGSTVSIWDASNGREINKLSGHGAVVYSAVYSPDGASLVTASLDKTARIWDASSGAQLALLSGHRDGVSSALYSPDGSHIVTAGLDKTARIWDSHSGVQVAILSGHTDQVYTAEYARDGTRIVTASNDRTARIWDAGRPMGAVLSGHRESVSSAAFSPDGGRIVTASFDKNAIIWDARSRSPRVTLTGHGAYVYSAAYSQDGLRIVTASRDKTARIWDARTGAQLRVLSGHSDNVRSATFSPDGMRVVTASRDKTARVWDAHTGQQLLVLNGHDDSVSAAAYSPDSTRVVTASLDNTARIWDAHTGTQLLVLSGHDGTLYSAAYSPDGTRIVTASRDRTARIWDARTGIQLAVLAGHHDVVSSAAFSPDGGRIATSSMDGTARIWDALTGEQLAALVGHDAGVLFTAYSPDGTQIVTASGDKTARLWDAHVQTNVAAQIAWYAAAETNVLSDVERSELGLPRGARVRSFPASAAACDRAAAAFYDPDRLAAGAARAQILVDIAKSACAPRNGEAERDGRWMYELARTAFAQGDWDRARHGLENAVTRGYRAALIDLGDLLVEPSAHMLDPRRALALYRQAWDAGVPIAAFRLGDLYEHGASADADTAAGSVPPDATSARQWYTNGADAGEPSALARSGERVERDALAEANPVKRNMRLLEALRRYAAAAERARDEDWPEDTWKNWAYRRASLARILAKEGLMLEVAHAYTAVLALSHADGGNELP